MSNYRRLISYIYAYEGGVKGKNIGYAKIEVRNNLCRIQVSVKKVYVGSSEIGVYLLSHDTELSLGRIFIRNGAGEFRIQVRPDNIEGSGLGIDQCYGLTIHDVNSTWRSYTTIWEDAVAQAAEVQLEDVTVEKLRSKEEPEAEKITLRVSEEIEQQLEQERKHLEESAPWEECTVEAEEIEKESQESAETTEQVAGEPTEEDDEQPVLQSITETIEETEREEKMPSVQNEEHTAPEPEDVEKLQELDRLEREEINRSQLWNRLERQYAKVLAFEYDNGCEILSIKPQDIGLLPRETWVYGNNSFLLHGYYNYRHLILARLENPQGVPRYLLGVPGHYFSNEKYMASMFGFPHFVLAKKQPAEDGRFGYWYTDIRL